MKKNILFSIFLSFGCFTALSVNQNSFDCTIKYLTNHSTKYWDPYWKGLNDSLIGNGLIISKDFKLREFYYDKSKKRRFVSYGDVIMDTLKWKLIKDTLQYDTFKFKITLLNKDTLILQDLQRIWDKDFLFFKASRDQISTPKLP